MDFSSLLDENRLIYLQLVIIHYFIFFIDTDSKACFIWLLFIKNISLDVKIKWFLWGGQIMCVVSGSINWKH